MVLDPNYRKTRKTHSYGTRALQPLATDVLEGTLYFVSDESVIERSNGTIWQSYFSSGSSSGSGTSISSPLATDGEDGYDSYIPGPSGSAGNVGATGATGASGAAGATGAQGIPGISGIPGIDGEDGLDAFPVHNSSGGSAVTVPGSDTQVIFNDSGILGADSGLVFNKTTNSLSILGLLDLSGAAAGQIKFPATQNASSDANTLDDYEEGTWTPNDASGAGLTLLSPDSHVAPTFGSYVKIGQMVYIAYGAQWPVTADASQAKMGNFPFATENNTPAVYWGQTLIFSTSTGVMTSINANVTWTSFYSYPPTPTPRTNVQLSNLIHYGNFQYRCTG